MKKIGILAYGSLINNPGSEIGPLIDKCIEVKTRFKVEFARISQTRGGAPTLVPVEEGGSKVKGKILILKESVSKKEAKNKLFQRETWNVGNKECKYKCSSTPGPNTIQIIEEKNFHGVEMVLYTKIDPNIPIKDRTPKKLAEWAIKSAQQEEVAKEEKDGISYLIGIKRCGVTTPLTEKYEEAILEITGTSSLEEARKACRKGHVKIDSMRSNP